jgi:cytochrome b561
MNARYSPAQQVVHWLTAVLMFSILPVAWIVGALKEDTPPFYFWLDVHKTLGLSILFLTLLRIVLRLRTPAPAYPADWPAYSKLGAKVVVIGLLALMIAMPITGYVWTTGHGYDVAPFDIVRQSAGGAPGRGELPPDRAPRRRAAADAAGAEAVERLGRELALGVWSRHLKAHHLSRVSYRDKAGSAAMDPPS